MFFTKLIVLLVATLELNATLVVSKATKHLSADTRWEYSKFIVEAGMDHNVDPLLIASVMWTESNFTNLKRNVTKDYGLMQVHWQKMPWLKGLKRSDLYDPRTNIQAGVKELAHVKRFCERLRHKRRHKWWGHYLAGPYITKADRPKRNKKIRWYMRKINRRYQYLKRIRSNLKARNLI